MNDPVPVQHRPVVAAESAQSRASAPSANVVIALLVASAFVMVLNETTMGVALPALIVDLRVSANTAQWLASGYLTTMAVVLPTTGFLLQRFTVRSAFTVAVTLFCTGTALAGVAPDFAVLLAARVVQATGSAVMIPLLMTTIMKLVPQHRRGEMMGTISVVMAVAPAVGPTLSGAVVSSLGWRWLFWIVLPFAVVTLAAGLRWLRFPTGPQPISSGIDVVSVPLSAIAFVGMISGLSFLGYPQDQVMVSPWVPLVGGAVAMGVFGWRQVLLQRRDAALLDLRPFTYHRFSVSLTLVVLAFAALFGAIFILPLYVQDVLGRSALVAGLVVLPGSLVMGAVSPFAGRIYDRRGVRVVAIPGVLVMCVGLWGLAVLGASSAIWLVVVWHVVMSLGQAMLFTPLMTDALAALPERLYSHGSSIAVTLQVVAGAAGTALFVTVMATVSQSGGAVDLPGVHAAFAVAAALAVVVAVVALIALPVFAKRPLG